MLPDLVKGSADYLQNALGTLNEKSPMQIGTDVEMIQTPQSGAVTEHSITATMERTGRNLLGAVK